MRTFPTLIALLVMTLSIAACGASEPQQSGQAAPSRETQATPATQGAPTEENAQKESTPKESAPQENVQGGEGGEAAGLSVTTIEGEQVSLGEQGEVTALYFMAGW